jgi:hypothetical protein
MKHPDTVLEDYYISNDAHSYEYQRFYIKNYAYWTEYNSKGRINKTKVIFKYITSFSGAHLYLTLGLLRMIMQHI